MIIADLKKEVKASFPALKPNFRVIGHLDDAAPVAPEERAYFISTICAESEPINANNGAGKWRVQIGALSC